MKQFFPSQTGEQLLLSKIIDYKLDNFFKQGMNRKESIKILYLEQELPLGPEKIKINTKHGPVYLKGKLDRVDERMLGGNRRIVILDYKTGVYSLPKKSINKDCLISREEIKKVISSFQLPLYIYLFSQSRKISSLGIQASFYSLRETKEEFLFRDNHPQESLEIYLTAAKRIFSEILSPDCGFVRDDSDEHYCGFCPFPGLCKR